MLIPSGSGIPVSLSCIVNSKAQDSRFHKPKLPGIPYVRRQFFCSCISRMFTERGP